MRRILIFGAGYTGELAYRALSLDKGNGFEIVGFIDDAPNKYGKTLHCLKVLGNRFNIQAIAKLYDITEVIVAAPSMPSFDLAAVIGICRDAGLTYHVFSPLNNRQGNGHVRFPVRDLELAEVLALPIIKMSPDEVQNIVTGKTILVNGSGGSLGHELCRLVLEFGCEKLILVDRYEAYLYECIMSLAAEFHEDRILPVLTTNEETETLEGVFHDHRPDIVFQTSMRKHVPFLEATAHCVDNPTTARANWIRTLNLADLAVRCGSEYFCMISSLAAGHPNGNSILTSLRIAELSLQCFLNGTNTYLVIPRISDVVENRGGIVSILEEQIRRRAMITLPHPEVRTHLLSKRSAAEFILQTIVEAARRPNEKGVFLCDAGPAVTLEEVACGISGFHGCKLGTDISIRYMKNAGNVNSSNLSSNCPLLETGHKHIKFMRENITVISHKLFALESEMSRIAEDYPHNDNANTPTEGIGKSQEMRVDSIVPG